MSEETFVNVCCDCVDLFIDSCIELKTEGEHQLQEGSIVETGCNDSTCKHTQLYKYSIYNTIRGMAKSRREGVTGRASIVQLSNSGLPTDSYLQFQRLKESASRAC